MFFVRDGSGSAADFEVPKARFSLRILNGERALQVFAAALERHPFNQQASADSRRRLFGWIGRLCVSFISSLRQGLYAGNLRCGETTRG